MAAVRNRALVAPRRGRALPPARYSQAIPDREARGRRGLPYRAGRRRRRGLCARCGTAAGPADHPLTMARATQEDRRHPKQMPAPKKTPALEREMSELRVVRKVRVSLATKFTLPVVALLSLVVILFGLVVYAHMANALDEELDSNGLLAASLGASPEIDSWDRSYNTVANLRNRLAAIESELELARGNLAEGSEPSKSAEEAAIRKKLEKFDEEQRVYNQNRLNALLKNEKGALDVLIMAKAGGLVA